MPTLIAADPTFVDTAPHLVIVEQIIEAPARAIWPVLADIGSWSEWYDDMSRSDVTSSVAEGIGAARTVKVGMLVADERFVLWTPGKALAFTVTRTNVPMAKRMLERVELEPVSGHSTETTRVRYTGAFLPHALTGLTFGLSKRMVRSSWTKGLAGLDRHVMGTVRKRVPG